MAVISRCVFVVAVVIGLLSSPLALLLAAALSFGGVQTWRLDSAQDEASAYQAALATCNANTRVQNQRIEIFLDEARIMGENLKKHREAAAKLRLQGDKKVRAILAAPSEKTCQKAVGSAIRDIQERFRE